MLLLLLDLHFFNNVIEFLISSPLPINLVCPWIYFNSIVIVSSSCTKGHLQKTNLFQKANFQFIVSIRIPQMIHDFQINETKNFRDFVMVAYFQLVEKFIEIFEKWKYSYSSIEQSASLATKQHTYVLNEHVIDKSSVVYFRLLQCIICWWMYSIVMKS